MKPTTSGDAMLVEAVALCRNQECGWRSCNPFLPANPPALLENAQATVIGHPKLPAGRDPKDIGNFVLIDHQNGEYSLLVHMKPGSVLVHSGSHVMQGQRIGAIGFAGDRICIIP
jgi:Peptidase family M23